MTHALTIGMAVHDDYDGVYMTVASLITHHQRDLSNAEIIIVDNAPHTRDGQLTLKLCESLQGAPVPVRYIAMPQPVGTSPPRNAIFQHARGEYVLVVDAHVLLIPDSLRRLRTYLETHHPCDDLIQGLIISENHRHMWTHFDDCWRAEMWGIFGTDPRGLDPNGEPFEIFAQGLGLFCARRETWLGFHPLARGFGGEECYIHEKYRRAGRRCLCLPGFGIVHRFSRSKPVTYPLTQWNKVRNYVLELNELGIPLDRLYRHFVLGEGEQPPDGSAPQGALNRMSQEWWDYLIADPVTHVQPPHSTSGCGGCGGHVQISSIEQWYNDQSRLHPDLRGHIPRLRELADGKRLVVELGTARGGSTAAFLASTCQRVISVDTVTPHWMQRIAELAESRWEFIQGDSRHVELPEQIDLLFIDTRHTADQLWDELTRHAPRVNGRIALHDTHTFGEYGEDGGPGLLPALRRFLREHPEWIVLKHYTDWNGLTIISNLAEDRPKLPSTAKQVFNFAKALGQHLANGARGVTEEQLAQRLDICALCEHRSGNRCSICGCYLIDAPTGLGGKAEWAREACPLGKWLPIDGGS